MKQTIENLWSGNIAPGESCGVGVIEIENLTVRISKYEEMLKSELSQPHKDLFERCKDCTDEYTFLISKCAFSDGFCLACRLMAEAMTESGWSRIKSSKIWRFPITSGEVAVFYREPMWALPYGSV